MGLTSANPAAGDGGAAQAFRSRQNYACENNRQRVPKQDALSAELSGDSFCRLGEVVTTGRTPVLALCRQLLAQGVSPDQALEVYRNGTLALRVRSIGEGARLTVKSAGNGAPIFAPNAPPQGAGASYSDFLEAAE
jgi:hypothetical protein